MKITTIKGGFAVSHTTREVWGVDDGDAEANRLDVFSRREVEALAEAETEPHAKEALRRLAEMPSMDGPAARQLWKFYQGIAKNRAYFQAVRIIRKAQRRMIGDGGLLTEADWRAFAALDHAVGHLSTDGRIN